MTRINLVFSQVAANHTMADDLAAVETRKVRELQCLKGLSTADRTEVVAKARFIDAEYALTPAERELIHTLVATGSKAQSLKPPMDHDEAFEVASTINEFLVHLTTEDREAGALAWEKIPKIHQMWLIHHAKKNGADISKIWESRSDCERAVCASVGYMLGLEMSIQPVVYPDRAESAEVIARLDATGS